MKKRKFNDREEKMKTRRICSGLTVAAILGLSLGIGLVSAGAPAGAPENEIIIEGKKPARFNHATHSAMGIDCGVCHHDGEHNPLTSESIGALADGAELGCLSCHNDTHPNKDMQKPKDVFHALCQTCHKEGYEGKNGPTKCTDCHIKQNKALEGC
jgi:hypothetical protein